MSTKKQKRSREVLERLEVFRVLAEFSPVLAGTIPLAIDVADSDLDIICEVKEFEHFQKVLKSHFGALEGFSISQVVVRGVDSIVCNFRAFGFPFEIFGQNVPVAKQYAVVHLRVEERLLKLGGKNAIKEIRRLKTRGVKTEPAFAKYFGIKGDPYDELYKLHDKSDEELSQILKPALGQNET